MRICSIIDFLKTGALGPIRVGMRRRKVMKLLRESYEPVVLPTETYQINHFYGCARVTYNEHDQVIAISVFVRDPQFPFLSKGKHLKLDGVDWRSLTFEGLGDLLRVRGIRFFQHHGTSSLNTERTMALFQDKKKGRCLLEALMTVPLWD